MFRFSVYTGPTIVAACAEKLRAAGVTVYCEGTEHVYVETPLTADQVAAVLGSTWSWRDVRAIR